MTPREEIERLQARLEAAGCHYGIPIERDCADAAAMLRALLAVADWITKNCSPDDRDVWWIGACIRGVENEQEADDFPSECLDPNR